jgi:pimeloyl-ACP methyl ester carboxylesterase
MPRISSSDPFTDAFAVEVAGGTLNVARAGPPPSRAAGVVLAAHGLTPGLMTWRTLARRLDDRLCLLAPDLRGRGHSATLPGPYGLAAHVTDLLAVLDHVDAPPAVLLGHSMGSYIVERLASEHPERARAVVLLDSGIPIASTGAEKEITRIPLALTWPSPDWAVELWRMHPAFTDAWDDDIETYVRYNLADRGGVCGLGAAPEAVRIDLAEIGDEDATRTALDGVQVPIELIRAERGVFDDDPVLSEAQLAAFAAAYPAVQIETVPGTNHYTIVLGPGPGARRVAAVIERRLEVQYAH